MAITILAPAPAAVPFEEEESSSEEESDGGGVHLGGDTDLPPAKRARDSTSNLVTPGEMVTDDPQWMRHVTLHSSFVHASNNTPEVTVPSLRPRARR
jgi:exosome complex component RRP4